MNETYFTVEEVAERLKVNEQTVRRWLREGDLVGIPFGGRTGWRVTEIELQAFIRRRQEEGQNEGKAAA